MKKIFFLCIAIALSFTAYSQDIIIKKNGEEVKAKILEIGVTEIKYKRFDFQDGPVYSIGKAEVILVRYENGVNEVITTAPPATSPAPATQAPAAPAPAPVQPENGRIENNMGTYRQNGRYISKTRVISLLRATNDPEIITLLKKSNASKTTGNVIALGVGLPLIVVGSFTSLRGLVLMNNDYSVDPDAEGIATVGAVMTGGGIMLQFLNIGFHSKSNRMIERAIEVYNAKHAVKAESK